MFKTEKDYHFWSVRSGREKNASEQQGSARMSKRNSRLPGGSPFGTKRPEQLFGAAEAGQSEEPLEVGWTGHFHWFFPESARGKSAGVHTWHSDPVESGCSVRIPQEKFE
jgi:hypothetical protein